MSATDRLSHSMETGQWSVGDLENNFSPDEGDGRATQETEGKEEDHNGGGCLTLLRQH